MHRSSCTKVYITNLTYAQRLIYKAIYTMNMSPPITPAGTSNKASLCSDPNISSGEETPLLQAL